MSEMIERVMNKFRKLKGDFDSKYFNVNLWKPKTMVSRCITKNGLYKSKLYPSEICNLRVKANQNLCVKYCKWIHSGRAGEKRVTTVFCDFACRKCERILEMKWNRMKRYVMKWKQQDLSLLSIGNMMSYSIEQRFPLQLKGALYKNCV